MKNLIFGAVLLSVCVFAVSAKEHPKKEKIVAFYTCVVCTDDPVIKEEYEKCNALKSELMIEMKNHCFKEILGDDVDVANHGKELCENDGMGKMFDCLIDLKEKRGIEPTEEQKKQFSEFKTCARELNEKHCK